MERREGPLERLSHFVQTQLVWLVIGSYLAACCFPLLGLWLKNVPIVDLSLGVAKMRLSASMLLLSALLLNAGLGVGLGSIRDLLRSPGLLGAGLGANLIVPVAFIFIVTRMMAGWHNSEEVQTLLVGLAIVASMPIAGSSTAWAQHADGEVALSLAMVLASTLISPLTTPIALRLVGLMASGEYALHLNELAAGGTGMFLTLCVLTPSLLGIGLRRFLSDEVYAAIESPLKLVNAVILVALNYCNASVSLPQAVANPDLDFLVVTLGIVVGLCTVGFAAGWSLSRLLKTSPSRRASLMFGLGMNNNGSGLVLASMALADHPRVMLPGIFYNLVQHLVAGVVDRLLIRRPAVECAA